MTQDRAHILLQNQFESVEVARQFKSDDGKIDLGLDIDEAYRQMREKPGMTLILTPTITTENGRTVIRQNIVRTDVDIIEK
jgi:hypothetical protein